MSGGNESVATTQSFTPFVWISTSDTSPNAAVIGNPVVDGSANSMTVGAGSNSVQDITSMSNATASVGYTTTSIIQSQPQATRIIAETAAPQGFNEPQATIIQVDPSSSDQVETSSCGLLEHSLSQGHSQDSAVIEVTADSIVCTNEDLTKFYLQPVEAAQPPEPRKVKKKQGVRRRLSPAHREMIIDLVFNGTKTSREVARYMGLPQSTVMSVVQVFKKEHRVHKKTATGRKRRLTTSQELELFEMSRERENVSVDEIKTKFLEKNPEFSHISKTTIYRTLDRGKKGLIGMESKPSSAHQVDPRIWKPGSKKLTFPVKGSGKMTLNNGVNISVAEPSISIMEEAAPIDEIPGKESKQRRSLSIAEREMIISLFFNENRTIREVADFMHLAKSTVSSVVQVFKKEHRIQRKTSSGRKKKLSDEHEAMIMEIFSQKDDITIEEARNRFMNLHPEVPIVSKSTIYRIMENCQSKMARSDMEVFVGTFVHSTDSNPMVILNANVLGVLNSKIEFMESVEELDHLKAEYGFSDSNIHYMTANQFMIPGFVDAHIHAPHLTNCGVRMDLPYIDRLQMYTYPTEANFSNTLYAREVYSKTVGRLLRCGTTTAAYYGTLHLEGTKALADVILEKGQRAVVGKVNMLRNCPDYYKENSLQDSLADTEAFIRYVLSLQSHLVQPAVTPRFAPTCSEEQMLQLGQLVNEFGCHVQSHLCETKSEVRWIKESFPWAKSCTEVYDNMRLLGEKTVLAHCVWLEDQELYNLRVRGCGIVHCPNSNLSSRSGICDVRKLQTHGIKIALGTDCSDGSSWSMLDAIRHAVQSSNVLSIEREQADYHPLSVREAFMMATLGGAKVLNFESKIGNFEIDKEFDALLINVAGDNFPFDILAKDSIEEKIEKFLFLGDDRNIVRTYVAGKKLVDTLNKDIC